jgi:hypothetical protein
MKNVLIPMPAAENDIDKRKVECTFLCSVNMNFFWRKKLITKPMLADVILEYTLLNPEYTKVR